MLKKLTVCVVLALSPQTAFADTFPCGNAQQTRSLDLVIKDINWHRDRVANVQRFLRDGFGYSRMAVDGKSGKNTNKALCSTMIDYTKITGEKIITKHEAQVFVTWMAAWTYDKQQAEANGSTVEAAD